MGRLVVRHLHWRIVIGLLRAWSLLGWPMRILRVSLAGPLLRRPTHRRRLPRRVLLRLLRIVVWGLLIPWLLLPLLLLRRPVLLLRLATI